MTLCKLTNEYNKTYNDTQWGEGVTHVTSGECELCGSGWIHYYDSPLVAVLLNPIHAGFINPNLWSIMVNGEIKKGHDSKFGTTSLTTIERIPLPEINPTQKIIFGILCAFEVYHDEEFKAWGKRWIDGSDRSVKAAEAVVTRAAVTAERNVAWNVSWAAWNAAVAATRAARDAFSVEWLAKVVREAVAVEWAERAVVIAERNVAWNVACAAAEAAKTNVEIDFNALAQKAITCG
jgi:hypothetical protein